MAEIKERMLANVPVRAMLAFACALVLALGTAGSAWAETYYSPEGKTANGSESSLTVESEYESDDGGLHVNTHDTPASNVPSSLPSNQKLLDTYRITTWGNLSMDQARNVTLTFYVGTKYAGANAVIYVQHETEPQTTETRSVIIQRDGTCSITMERLSIFSIVVDEDTIGQYGGAGASSTSSSDSSATSPQTGVSAAPAAAVACCALAGAFACAVALRRRAQD